MNGPLVLVDGTLLVFRSLYGMPDVFTDGHGRPVNAVRGYLGWLIRLLTGEVTGAPVRRLVVAFDESLTTCWRNAVYPPYKANRPEPDENIREQLRLCRAMTETVGIPTLADPEWEADDFIATLAKRSRGPVLVISRDKDLRQLLSHRVQMMDPQSGTLMDAPSFIEVHGFEPLSFPDYQALTGDGVDNVPGVSGIGAKTAGRLIAEFGTLEALYAGQSRWPQVGLKMASAQARKLAAGEADAFLYRRILRLRDDVPLPLSLAECRWRRPDRADLRVLLDAERLQAGIGNGLCQRLEALGD